MIDSAMDGNDGSDSLLLPSTAPALGTTATEAVLSVMVVVEVAIPLCTEMSLLSDDDDPTVALAPSPFKPPLLLLPLQLLLLPSLLLLLLLIPCIINTFNREVSTNGAMALMASTC